MRLNIKDISNDKVLATLNTDPSQEWTGKLYYDLLVWQDKYAAAEDNAERIHIAKEAVTEWLVLADDVSQDDVEDALERLPIGAWLKLWEKLCVDILDFIPCERFADEQTTYGVAKKRMEKEAMEAANDIAALDELVGKKATHNLIMKAKDKLVMDSSIELINSDYTDTMLQARIQLLKLRAEKVKQREARKASPQFEYKGDRWEIPFASIALLASQDLNQSSDFVNPNITLSQFIEIEEFRRQLKRVNESEGERLRSMQYTFAVRNLAVLARKLDGAVVEQWPTSLPAIRQRIEQRMKYFEAIPLDALSDANFFLLSMYSVLRATSNTRTFGKANRSSGLKIVTS